MIIQNLLDTTVNSKASDLHLTVGAPPTMRISGRLTPVPGTEILTPSDCEELVFQLLTDEQKEILQLNKELDFSFALGQVARFRVNAFHQKGYVAAALRAITLKIPTIEELNLPEVCYKFAGLPQGFVLVTGPAGQGKSTTIAAILDEINRNQQLHIVTIEDPIEYVFSHKQSLVDQRELHLDTHSWDIALRSVLREDPDVVFIGEMRDFETIASAITLAETGHLVFSTLHTNSAAQTIDRVVDVFPELQQAQVRVQLAAMLEGIVSQRLIPAIGGGLAPAVEVLLTTPAVRTIIREGKTHQIDNVITTSGGLGMISLEGSLARLVKSGKISVDEARRHSSRSDELERHLTGK